MASTRSQQRAWEEISRLTTASLDAASFRLEAVSQLRRGVGFDGWCWTLADPDTGVSVHAVADNPVLAGQQRRFMQLEHQAADVNKPADPRDRPGEVGVLSAATQGDLARSTRWRELLGPGGLGDELRAGLTTTDHAYWGHLTLYRDSSAGWFTPAEAGFVAEVKPLLARGSRAELKAAAMVPLELADADAGGPGTLVLDAQLAPIAATWQARRWLDELGPDPPSRAEPLPAFLFDVAARLGPLDERPRSPGSMQAGASARVLTAGRRWFVVHAARLTPDGGSVAGRVAITIEPARGTDIAPLLMRAHALSRRERDVTALLLNGLSSDNIAAALFVSVHTVRDHTKAVFGKVGVHSRRQLAAALGGEDRVAEAAT